MGSTGDSAAQARTAASHRGIAQNARQKISGIPAHYPQSIGSSEDCETVDRRFRNLLSAGLGYGIGTQVGHSFSRATGGRTGGAHARPYCGRRDRPAGQTGNPQMGALEQQRATAPAIGYRTPSEKEIAFHQQQNELKKAKLVLNKNSLKITGQFAFLQRNSCELIARFPAVYQRPMRHRPVAIRARIRGSGHSEKIPSCGSGKYIANTSMR